MFARSTNGGASFSAAQRINDDPVNPSKWHWFGTLSVAPNGRIDAVWYDTRNAANNTDSQLFYSYSTDGGMTFTAIPGVLEPNNIAFGAPAHAGGYPVLFMSGYYQGQPGMWMTANADAAAPARARSRSAPRRPRSRSSTSQAVPGSSRT